MTRHVISAVAVGILIGLIVAAVMTTLDWRLNPGGIFHNEHGTDWRIMMDTALSWFLPVAATASAIAAVILFLLARRNRESDASQSQD